MASLSRLLPAPTVLDENRDFYRVTQSAYIVGLIVHLFCFVSFGIIGVSEMALFNGVISVPAFTLALILNRRGQHDLAFALAFFELFGHQLAATYYTGWGFGAHYWLIYLGGLCFFSPTWRLRTQLMLLAVVAAGYVSLFVFFQEGVYLSDLEAQRGGTLGNAIAVIAALSLLISYYSRSTHRAQRELRNEQSITQALLAKVEALFGQQVSTEIAREMIDSDTELPSKAYTVTVMFLDIRDFTLFADSREPSEVAQFQNLVFGELIEIIREQGGVVLQILGDGLMAVFGAPVVHSDHAQRAVNAGLAAVDKVEALGAEGRIPPIRIGIGLHSGDVIAGNLGNAGRKFYSLTGTTVIIAARVEPLNKTYSSQMLITDSVWREIGATGDEVTDLGEVSLKGIEAPVGLYQLR